MGVWAVRQDTGRVMWRGPARLKGIARHRHGHVLAGLRCAVPGRSGAEIRIQPFGIPAAGRTQSVRPAHK